MVVEKKTARVCIQVDAGKIIGNLDSNDSGSDLNLPAAAESSNDERQKTSVRQMIMKEWEIILG